MTVCHYPELPIPAKAGIGLRSQHYQEIIHNKPAIPWLEGHSENFFAEGGINRHVLEQIRPDYPMSFHGVGLSLGSAQEPDKTHLSKLKQLVDTFEPALVSEHVSWSNAGDNVLNDLLPLPYTFEAVSVLARNIAITQEALGRQILIENPSSYLQFSHNEMEEYAFIAEVVKQSGCGILLDVNNIYVTHKNHGIDPITYLEHLPLDQVQEIHLAGHAVTMIEGKSVLIDHHGAHVIEPVWELFRETIKRTGLKPTLIEWDTDIPPLDVLMAEAEKAQLVLDSLQKEVA